MVVKFVVMILPNIESFEIWRNGVKNA